jgi:hypothetical protein
MELKKTAGRPANGTSRGTCSVSIEGLYIRAYDAKVIG